MHAVARPAYQPSFRPRMGYRAKGIDYDPRVVGDYKGRRVPKRKRGFRAPKRRVRRVAELTSEEEYDPANPGPFLFGDSDVARPRVEGKPIVFSAETGGRQDAKVPKPYARVPAKVPPAASASPWTKRYAPERYANASSRVINDNDDEKSSKTKRIRNLAEHYTSEALRNAQSRGKRLSQQMKDRISAKMWRFAVVKIRMEKLGLRQESFEHPLRHIRDAVVRSCRTAAHSQEDFEEAVEKLELKDFKKIEAYELGTSKAHAQPEQNGLAIMNANRDYSACCCASPPRRRADRVDAPGPVKSKLVLRSGFSSWDIQD
eukprot:CAMPEP_0170176322 /NCGR_PEP_ID=MMETSP0040_2-20121228/9224_1 /TAXON_ID=641309 /ORGANISM="Lotharella oceanica, Strain CCMP622" /LENGTH=316 /DNA_ID=CAMNT_0010418605 /DNA_START=60 /DNA_END=1010 /DNA_ORIENTATION=+